MKNITYIYIYIYICYICILHIYIYSKDAPPTQVSRKETGLNTELSL